MSWTIIDLFTQAGATILGVLAVYFAGKKNKWGFAAGLASQPFWYATTIMHGQWILTIVNVAFTVSWIIGFREWFFLKKSDDLEQPLIMNDTSFGVDFRIAEHSHTGSRIVEVLLDGNVVAVIYPEDYRGIKLVSAHIDGQPDYDDGIGRVPPIPMITVNFDPRPYRIQGGLLIRD